MLYLQLSVCVSLCLCLPIANVISVASWFFFSQFSLHSLSRPTEQSVKSAKMEIKKVLEQFSGINGRPDSSNNASRYTL